MGLARAPTRVRVGGTYVLVGRGCNFNRSRMEQYASTVVNFSSQYGTAGTSSYTASNLASDLSVYPKYGDFTEAFVLVS